MSDFLKLTGIHVEAIIGVHAWEQQLKQVLLIDVKVPTNFSNCSDDLNEHLDYDALCICIRDYFAQNSFKLIEKAADCLAMHLINQFKLEAIALGILKPGAVKQVKDIRVEVQRKAL